jgi:hypothetical protein
MQISPMYKDAISLIVLSCVFGDDSMDPVQLKIDQHESTQMARCKLLAEGIASSAAWSKMHDVELVIRFEPYPAIAVLGSFDNEAVVRLTALSRQLKTSCKNLRYISYAQAEGDCRMLAEKLVERFGRDELEKFQFKAIPRGGMIVLGMLAYALGLDRRQLTYPASNDMPLVVIDDCSLTGKRFADFIENCQNDKIIFATLYSHPELRSAIEAREPRVVACLSAHDLQDHWPETMGGEYLAAREKWLARMKDKRYWFGQTDHICFAWSEPDRLFWNPVTEKVESGWHLLPPELCLKNRSDSKPIPVQVQPEGKGPLRPSERVIFACQDGQIIIGDLVTKESFRLDGVAADMWNAVIETGEEEAILDKLLIEYDVDEIVLRSDLQAFIDDLLARGILVVRENAERQAD